MSYDLDRSTLLRPHIPTPRADDLETIVTLLELGAILLTNTPDDAFTADQLFEKAREIGGDEISLARRDVEIVLAHATFLRKTAGMYSLR